MSVGCPCVLFGEMCIQGTLSPGLGADLLVPKYHQVPDKTSASRLPAAPLPTAARLRPQLERSASSHHLICPSLRHINSLPREPLPPDLPVATWLQQAPPHHASRWELNPTWAWGGRPTAWYVMFSQWKAAPRFAVLVPNCLLFHELGSLTVYFRPL